MGSLTDAACQSIRILEQSLLHLYLGERFRLNIETSPDTTCLIRARRNYLSSKIVVTDIHSLHRKCELPASPDFLMIVMERALSKETKLLMNFAAYRPNKSFRTNSIHTINPGILQCRFLSNGIGSPDNNEKIEPRKRGILRRFFAALNPFSKSSKSNDDVNKSSPPDKSKRQGRSLAVGPPIERLILRSHVTRDVDLARIVSKTAAGVIYSFLGVTIMGTLGIDTKPLITGLGVTGFTIGFALKEIATNFISGILLMFERPFEKGCKLKIHGGGGGLEGIVAAIDIRHVHLKTENSDAVVLVPSSVVYSNPLSVTRPTITTSSITGDPRNNTHPL